MHFKNSYHKKRIENECDLMDNESLNSLIMHFINSNYFAMFEIIEYKKIHFKRCSVYKLFNVKTFFQRVWSRTKNVTHTFFNRKHVTVIPNDMYQLDLLLNFSRISWNV